MILTVLAVVCIYVVLSTIITLGLYIQICAWEAAGVTRDNATKWQMATLYFFGACDAIYARTTGAVLLMVFPRRGELMFTKELRRIVKAQLAGTVAQRYRLTVAEIFCKILNMFSPNHCLNEVVTLTAKP